MIPPPVPEAKTTIPEARTVTKAETTMETNAKTVLKTIPVFTALKIENKSRKKRQVLNRKQANEIPATAIKRLFWVISRNPWKLP